MFSPRKEDMPWEEIGRRFEITLNHVRYTSKTSVSKHAKAILRSGVVSEADARFIMDLVKEHPHATEKIGKGIVNVRIGKNPAYGSPEFWVDRCDGSSTNVGIGQCVHPVKQCTLFRQACRTAIQDQIDAFRLAQDFTGLTCPMTGDIILPTYCHVDHHEPQFEMLVRMYLGEYKINADLVPLEKSSSGTVSFKEDDGTFAQFHRDHATLRILSPEGNLTRKRSLCLIECA